MDKLPDDILKKCREPFPAESIAPYPGKPYLSTIKAIYITERLNKVFGVGRWVLEHQSVDALDPEFALVRGELKLLDYPDLKITPQYGGHKTQGKNTDPADGFKSAVTDCLSKCASYLEIGIDVFKGKQTHEKKTVAEITKEVYDEAPRTAPPTDGVISEAQRKRLFAIATENKKEEPEIKKIIEKYGYSKIKNILKKDYEAIVNEVSIPF
jgi:hypothetical protein